MATPSQRLRQGAFGDMADQLTPELGGPTMGPNEGPQTPRVWNPPKPTLYGAPEGVATDQGAAEGLRRSRLAMPPNAGPQTPRVWNQPGPTLFGTPAGPTADLGAAQAVLREGARMGPNAGPSLPGGMGPNTGPTAPLPMGPNSGPSIPGGMGPNSGPSVPGGMGPNTGPVPQAPSSGWFRKNAPRTAAFGDAAAGFAGDKLRMVAKGASALAPAVLPLVGGYGASKFIDAATDRANANTPDAPAPQGPGQIPIDPNGPKAPQAQPSNWLRDTETGRNIAAATNALGPVAPVASEALRTGTALANTFSGVSKVSAPALSAATRAAPMVGAAAVGAGMASPEPQSFGGAPGKPNPNTYLPNWRALESGARGDNDLRRSDRVGGYVPTNFDENGKPAGNLSSYLAGGGDGTPFDPMGGRGGGKDGRLPTDLFQLQQGSVYKTVDPKTGRTVYSGVNVKENADIRNGSGAMTGRLRNGPDQNVIDGVPMAAAGMGFNPGGAAATQKELAGLVAERKLREADQAAHMQTEPIGFSGETIFDRPNKNSGSGSMPKGMSGRQQVAWQTQQEAHAIQREQMGQQLRLGVMGNNTQMQVAGMNNATSRSNNTVNNDTALRAQDIHQQTALAPLMLAAQQRAAAAQIYQKLGAGGKDGKAAITPDQHRQAGDMMHAYGLTDLGDKAYAAATSGQAIKGTQSKQARDDHDDLVGAFQDDPRFNTPDPKDPNKTVFDKAGAERAATAMQNAYGPKLDNLSQDEKKAAKGDIVAEQQLTDRLRQPEMGFGDHIASVFGQYRKPQDNTVLPNLRDLTPRRRGFSVIPGHDQNDILLEKPNGPTYNAGNLTDAQIKALETRGLNAKGLR